MHSAVVLVSYNTRDLLRRALRSVIDSAAEDTQQVVVVDNASRDGSAAMVADEFASRFPALRLVASPVNLGFTGGNNLALHLLGFDSVVPPQCGVEFERAARPRPDCVLLLNPDAELQGDALQRMARFLEATPNAGACGARLSYGDGSFQHGAFAFPTLFQVALDFFPLTGLPGAHRIHSSRWNGRYPMRLWNGTAPFAVDFVLGAAMMMRGRAIEQIGGLDDTYFMYCEEMDWCLRAREAGWGVYAVPTARVVHHEAQSSRQFRWRSFERLWHSRFRFYRQHPARYGPLHRIMLQALVRVGLNARSNSAFRRFANGELTGRELADEVETYGRIARL
jgi:GT2 family glycosyltransferase